MRWIAACVICVAVVLVPLAAQQPPAATEGFVPLSEMANREVLPATPLVFYAYGFVWVALMAYLWMIWRRIGKVEQDIESVRKRLP
jgi:CcmD family protein